jgi:hypothetical protein
MYGGSLIQRTDLPVIIEMSARDIDQVVAQYTGRRHASGIIGLA